jgi:hypothetical protein
VAVVEDEVAAIQHELERLKATKMDVGPVEDIRVRDRGGGNAQLDGSPAKTPDFHWFGKATEIRERPGCPLLEPSPRWTDDE